MQAYPDHFKHHYLIIILKLLYLEIDTFMFNLAHHHPYDILLYPRIVKLYTKGKNR